MNWRHRKMAKKNTMGLHKYAKAKNDETIEKVNMAIDKIKRSKNTAINFSTVAREAGVSKATLYNNAVLKERILGLRTSTKGVPNLETVANTDDRATNRNYLDEIRKLRKDKKNLILQLVEMEELREENARLKEQVQKLLGRGD